MSIFDNGFVNNLDSKITEPSEEGKITEPSEEGKITAPSEYLENVGGIYAPKSPSSLVSLDDIESLESAIEDHRRDNMPELVNARETLNGATRQNPINSREALFARAMLARAGELSDDFNVHVSHNGKVYNRSSISQVSIDHCDNLSTEEIIILAALGDNSQISKLAGEMIKKLNSERVTRLNPEKLTTEKFIEIKRTNSMINTTVGCIDTIANSIKKSNDKTM